MPRICHDSNSNEGEPRCKKRGTAINSTLTAFQQGEVLTNIVGQKWKVEKLIGKGSFGEIYTVCEMNSKKKKKYIAKVESYHNGPLFVEINCYLRIGRQTTINQWKENKNLNNLGIPEYIASGSHQKGSQKYRFLIIPQYETDLQLILNNTVLNLKTVITIAYHVINVLEYIHSKGYVHSDIKASNILLGKSESKYNSNSTGRNLKQRNTKSTCLYMTKSLDCNRYNFNEVVLADYGLATKYVHSNGEHKTYCPDRRRAHAGTILFCSRDAHEGISSRRSDLESLGYNMMFWLNGTLPWQSDQNYPNKVFSMKRIFFASLKTFLKYYLPQFYKFFYEYFYRIEKLKYNDKPNYNNLKKLFRDALQWYGYKRCFNLDFSNIEGWGRKKKIINNENIKIKGTTVISNKIIRSPLKPKNNLSLKPRLRKSTKNKLNWSQIIDNPENIIKKSRKLNEDTYSTSLINKIDINSMNPTYAMLEVYYKNSPIDKNKINLNYNDNIDGFTPAMINIYCKQNKKTLISNVSPQHRRKRQTNKIVSLPSSTYKSVVLPKKKLNASTELDKRNSITVSSLRRSKRRIFSE